jgi:uncharacterized protein YuzE
MRTGYDAEADAFYVCFAEAALASREESRAARHLHFI